MCGGDAAFCQITLTTCCYVTDGVAWSVCLSFAIVSPAKTAEPIEISLGFWTRLVPRNDVLDGVWTSMGSGNFLGKGRPIVKYRQYGPCAAAMRPFVKLL